MPTTDEYLREVLADAYVDAIDHGLQQLNLTRIGSEGTRQWQCSSRFPRSAGYHVHIEADPFDAILGALGAWARCEGVQSSVTVAPPMAVEPEEPAPGLFD